MRFGLFVIAATTLVGAHAAVVGSTSGSQEVSRELHEVARDILLRDDSDSDCEDGSDSDAEGAGSRKVRRCSKEGEKEGKVRIENNQLGYRWPRCYPNDGGNRQPCEQRGASEGSKCYVRNSATSADCPE